MRAETPGTGHVAICARISRNDQKADLDRQAARLASRTTEQGRAVSQGVQASAISDHRNAPERFGFAFIRSALQAQRRQARVAAHGATAFSLGDGRYGKSSAKRHAERALKAAIADAGRNGA